MTPPSVPAGLTATAASSTTVLLEWQASSDNGSGVAGYRVYRDGGADPIATVSSTSYTDTNLQASTQYEYTVRAFDAADPANVSSPSSTVTATTLGGGGPPGAVTLTVEPAFANLPAFASPVAALQAPGNGSTWYVVEQAGRVLAFDATPTVTSSRTVLDLRNRVTSGGERGLLGMAFHPGYPANPRAYLSYTTTVAGALTSRISEFQTRDGGQTLDPNSERVLLHVVQPAINHNGGHIAFGPQDGLLYIGFGDGGGGDGDDWGAFGNGQNLQTVLGKLLRIDVDSTSGGAPYGIPPDNRYAANAPCAEGEGTQPCPEIHAYGFRNPWRWSFDRVTGELWVGDVGQSAREEVDRVVAGGNYGWRCFEGTLTFNPDCGPNAGSSLPPVLEYGRDAGHAITGGYVYRGAALPSLVGQYVFGDYVTGRLWHVPRDVTPTQLVQAADAVDTGLFIASFAEAVDGELYVVDREAGALYRIGSAPP